jgi:hypothetical protein
MVIFTSAYQFQFEIIDRRLGKFKVELERFTGNYKQVEFYGTLDLTCVFFLFI